MGMDDFDACMGAATARPQWHVGALLGPPDAWPATGLVVGTYFPGCQICGKHFFVTELPEPIYLQKVLLYETGAIGTVVALYAAETYLGNATTWQSLWEGVPSDQDYTDNIFQPPICPTVSLAARYVKVVFDTDLADNTVSFDSLAFEGSIEPPRNIVWDDDERLFYRPMEGVHFSYGSLFQDEITVRASNCKANSPPRKVILESNVDVPVPRTLFGEPQEATAATGEMNLVKIQFQHALEHLSSALDTEILESEFTFEILLPEGNTSAMQLFHAYGAPMFLPDSYANGPKSILLSHPEIYIKKDKRWFETESLHVWLHCRNVTYRTALRIREVCPEAATVFECAPSASLCTKACDLYPLECQRAAEVSAGKVKSVLTYYNSEEGRCEILNAGNKSTIVVAYIVVPIIVIIAGLLFFCVYLLLVSTHLARKSLDATHLRPWHTSSVACLIVASACSCAIIDLLQGPSHTISPCHAMPCHAMPCHIHNHITITITIPITITISPYRHAISITISLC